MRSSIGTTVLTLHTKATQAKAITQQSNDADVVLDTLTFGPWVADTIAAVYPEACEAANTGRELYYGVVRSPASRSIRHLALRLLRDFDTFLLVQDVVGYAPLVVREALTTHYSTLERADLGSDANCIFIDIQAGINQLSESEQETVTLLVAGHTSREILTKLGTKVRDVIAHLCDVIGA